MKVKTLTGITKEDDIQIQSACARLGFDMVFPSDIYAGNVDIYLRLRYISSAGGTKSIWDKTSVVHLAEIDGFTEGAFEYTKLASGKYQLKASIAVGDGGALDLSDGYLSLDIDAKQTIETVTISNIDDDTIVRAFRRINPFTVNGITKDVELTHISGLALRPALLDNIQIQAGRTAEYTGTDLFHIARDRNDIVSVDTVAGTAVYNVKMFMVLDVKSASFARLTPSATAESQFYQYLLQSESI